MDEAKTESVNPLHVMDDEELVSRVCIKYRGMFTDDPDMHKVEFKKLRTELMYRLRRSHVEAWTPPKRLMERKFDLDEFNQRGDYNDQIQKADITVTTAATSDCYTDTKGGENATKTTNLEQLGEL